MLGIPIQIDISSYEGIIPAGCELVVAEHGCIDWDDLIHLSDDCDAYLNAVDGLSMALFGKPAVDLVEELDAAVHSLQDSFSSNGELPALNP